MIHSSSYPAVEIPGSTVYDYLFAGLSTEDAARVALTNGATSLTYGELRSLIDAFAGALAVRGVSQSDVVALHAPNSPAFVIAFHGILRAGATATTLNALYSPSEIASQLRDSGARTYVTVAGLLPAAIVGAAEAGLDAGRIIVLDGGAADAGASGHESLADLLVENRVPPEIDLDPASALAVLPYSSGTTGKAKGVMLTHTNLVANLAQLAPVLKQTPDTTVLAVLPLFHIYGMNVIMNLALRNRAKLVTMPKFDLGGFLAAIVRERVSLLFIAPPIAVALAKHPAAAEADLSSVETIVSGAAPMSESLGTALRARVPARLLQGFGMTELSPVSHITPWDDERMSVGSIGTAIPNIEFRSVGVETGEDIEIIPGAERSEPGEMWVRGPGVMAGYLGNPEATAATITADGWLRTGDIIEIGRGDEVYVVDRLKELIKYKGYQVPPAELEALLLTHPAVADAAVVAHPDEDAGEIPRAFVVLQPDSRASQEELIDFVAARVAPHKRIRLVDFIAEVPKAASGKILRKDLRGLPRP